MDYAGAVVATDTRLGSEGFLVVVVAHKLEENDVVAAVDVCRDWDAVYTHLATFMDFKLADYLEGSILPEGCDATARAMRVRLQSRPLTRAVIEEVREQFEAQFRYQIDVSNPPAWRQATGADLLSKIANTHDNERGTT